jgi:putative SOS response-associated peptidase YedK
MCGRFTQAHTWAEIIKAFNLLGPAPSNLRPRYNIAPTDIVDVIVDRGKGREMASMRWGLIPGWSKPDPKNPDKPASSFATFNARSEEVETKPTFRDSWRVGRRCIIPASGFFEWTGDKSARQPHYFTRKDGKIIGFAGLWEVWKNKKTGEEIFSCTILIHQPSPWMSRFHDRMPAILEEKDFDAWLTGKVGKEVLQPAPVEVLREWKVSTRVNKTGVGVEDPTIIDPIGPAEEDD